MIQVQTQAETTERTVNASGQTGTICSVSGPYKCSTTPSVTEFVKKGDTFPNAPKTGSATGQAATWVLVA